MLKTVQDDVEIMNEEEARLNTDNTEIRAREFQLECLTRETSSQKKKAKKHNKDIYLSGSKERKKDIEIAERFGQAMKFHLGDNEGEE